jgi:hypothetical protein
MTLNKGDMALINAQSALSESYTATGKANIALDKAQFTFFKCRLLPLPSAVKIATKTQ